MTPPLLTVFHNGFLTLTGASLGRLVPDATNPGQDFWPKSIPELNPRLVDAASFENLHEFSGAGTHAGLWDKVSKVFSGNVSRETSSFHDITANSVKRYTLLHPTDYFQTICKDDDTKRWIETTLKHFPIFLIVGLVTVKGTAVRQGDHEQKEAAASAQISATDILTSGVSAVLPIGGDVSSVGVGGSMGSVKERSGSFVATDERVIGVQYRKVKFSLFSKRDVNEAFLVGNPRRWQMFLGGDRAGTYDILEADLADLTSVDDLELECEGEMIGDDLVFVGDDDGADDEAEET